MSINTSSPQEQILQGNETRGFEYFINQLKQALDTNDLNAAHKAATALQSEMTRFTVPELLKQLTVQEARQQIQRVLRQVDNASVDGENAVAEARNRVTHAKIGSKLRRADQQIAHSNPAAESDLPYVVDPTKISANDHLTALIGGQGNESDEPKKAGSRVGVSVLSHHERQQNTREKLTKMASYIEKRNLNMEARRVRVDFEGIMRFGKFEGIELPRQSLIEISNAHYQMLMGIAARHGGIEEVNMALSEGDENLLRQVSDEYSNELISRLQPAIEQLTENENANEAVQAEAPENTFAARQKTGKATFKPTAQIDLDEDELNTVNGAEEAEVNTQADEAEGNAEAENTTTDTQPNAAPNTPTPNPTPNQPNAQPNTTVTLNNNIEGLGTSDVISGDTRTFLRQLLTYERIIREDNPVCLAINTLLESRFADQTQRDRLLSTLKTEGEPVQQNYGLVGRELVLMNHPAAYNVDLPPEDEVSGQQATAPQLKLLSESLDEEAESIREAIEADKNLQQQTDDQANLKGWRLARLTQIKVSKRAVAAAQQRLKSDKRYNSPRAILSLMLIHLNEDNRQYDMEAVANQTRTLIENEEGGMAGRQNRLGRFLKGAGRVTLGTFMQGLSEEKHFKKDLGEKAPEVLSGLVKPLMLSEGGYLKVKSWFDDIEMDEDKKMNKFLPALIREFEIALRKGEIIRAPLMDSPGIALRHLRRIRDESIRNKVFTEISDPEQRLAEYVKRINQADIDLNALEETSIWSPKKHIVKQRYGLLKAAGYSAAGAAALFAAPVALGGVALAGAIKYRKGLGKGLKHTGAGLKMGGNVIKTGAKGVKHIAKAGVNTTKYTYNKVLKPTVGVAAEGTSRLTKAYYHTMVGLINPLGLFTGNHFFKKLGSAGNALRGR